MALLDARLLLNLLVNESAMLVNAQGRYFLLRHGAEFRLELVPSAGVAPLLLENVVAPAVDDDWACEVLLPTAEGRRIVRHEVSDDACFRTLKA